MIKSVDSETQTETAKVVDAAVQTEPGNQTGVITEMYSTYSANSQVCM